MVFTADDQHFAAVDVSHQPNVVVGIPEMPKQRWGKRAGHDREADHVGPIRRLLGVHLDAIDKRSVGGDDDIPRVNLATVLELDTLNRTAIDRLRFHAGDDMATAREDGACEPLQILAWVKHCLLYTSP